MLAYILILLNIIITNINLNKLDFLLNKKEKIINNTYLCNDKYNNYNNNNNIITKIKIVNSNKIEKICEIISNTINEDYILINNKYIIQLIVKKLWESNLFNYVNANISNKDNIYTLNIILYDSWKINNIFIFGVYYKEIKYILNKYKIYNKKELNITKLKYLHFKINEILKKKKKEIQCLFIIKKKKKKYNIFINIANFKKIEVNNIKFVGNINIKSNILLKQLKNYNRYKIFKLLNKNKFIYKEIINECINIKNYYKSKGYKYIKIYNINLINYNKNKNYYDIVIYIHEGNKYKLGDIYLIGKINISKKIIDNIIQFKKNDIYNLNKIKYNIFNENNKYSLISYYLDNGYLSIQIKIKEININNNTICILIYINENEIHILNNIKIIGNITVKNSTIINKLSILKNSILSRKIINYNINNINKLNFIKKKLTYKIENIKKNKNKLYDNIILYVKDNNLTVINLETNINKKYIYNDLKINIPNLSINNLISLYNIYKLPKGDGDSIIFELHNEKIKNNIKFIIINDIEKSGNVNIESLYNYSNYNLNNINNINNNLLSNFKIKINNTKKINFLNKNLDILIFLLFNNFEEKKLFNYEKYMLLNYNNTVELGMNTKCESINEIYNNHKYKINLYNSYIFKYINDILINNNKNKLLNYSKLYINYYTEDKIYKNIILTINNNIKILIFNNKNINKNEKFYNLDIIKKLKNKIFMNKENINNFISIIKLKFPIINDNETDKYLISFMKYYKEYKNLYKILGIGIEKKIKKNKIFSYLEYIFNDNSIHFGININNL